MSTVWQVCDGFKKNTLVGNWNEERQFHQQAFRDQPQFKHVRPLQTAITTYDDKGFQRAMPRLSRRTKWDTSHVVVDDGFRQFKSRMKLDYPHGQIESYMKAAERPVDKNTDKTHSAPFHPHSEIKLQGKDYKVLTRSNMKELHNEREVPMNTTDFRSTFSVHQPAHNRLFSETTYAFSYGRSGSVGPRQEAQKIEQRNGYPAGSYNQGKNDSLKLVTTLICENHKKTNDLKEDTSVQRSWLPYKDRSVTHSMGRTATDFAFRHLTSNDIQTNTNTNIGVHNLHPKDVQPSYYRHVRQQDVTNRPNKTYSYK